MAQSLCPWHPSRWPGLSAWLLGSYSPSPSHCGMWEMNHESRTHSLSLSLCLCMGASQINKNYISIQIPKLVFVQITRHHPLDRLTGKNIHSSKPNSLTLASSIQNWMDWNSCLFSYRLFNLEQQWMQPAPTLPVQEPTIEQECCHLLHRPLPASFSATLDTLISISESKPCN